MDIKRQLKLIDELEVQAKDEHLLMGVPWRAALAARRSQLEARLTSPAWSQRVSYEDAHNTYWVMSGGQGMRDDLNHDFVPKKGHTSVCEVCNVDVETGRQRWRRGCGIRSPAAVADTMSTAEEDKPVRYCQARQMGGHFCLSPPNHDDDHCCTCGKRWPRG